MADQKIQRTFQTWNQESSIGLSPTGRVLTASTALRNISFRLLCHASEDVNRITVAFPIEFLGFRF